MPEELLDKFLMAFSMVKYPIIWATNGDVSYRLRSKSLPKNLIVLKWAPIKILLGKCLQGVI